MSLTEHIILPLPEEFFSFLIAAVLWLIFNFLLGKTRTGRHIYATGSNIEAARLSGVNILGTVIKAYVVSAFCSSIVGIITTATTGMGTMDAGNSYELYAVAAAVIGGVSTLGGQGILLGTVVGACIWGCFGKRLAICRRTGCHSKYSNRHY